MRAEQGRALKTQDSGLRTQDSGLRTQDSGLRTQDFVRRNDEKTISLLSNRLILECGASRRRAAGEESCSDRISGEYPPAYARGIRPRFARVGLYRGTKHLS